MSAAAPPFVVDVGDADFEQTVLQRSHQVPVVVDFWAPWCGPCRTLGPILERLAQEHAGAFVLAKLDTEANPQIAAQLQIRSIPLVIAYRDGKAVREFTGAQPEPAIREFLAAVLPTEADHQAREGLTLLAAGQGEAAEERFAAALSRDAQHPEALLGMARLTAERGDAEGALALLERISLAPAPVEQEAARLAAELRATSGGADGAEVAALEAKLALDPDDLGARLALGRSLAAERRYAEALAAFLAIVERDKAFDDEAARKAMVDIFEVLGGDHETTQEYRQALARALFR
jgi:putative thioredoxin